MKHFKRIQVEFSASGLWELEDFRKRCREHYPLEAFAILVGKWLSSSHVRVENVYVPPDMKDSCFPERIEIDPSWYPLAEEETELSVVGDIHSHPNTTPSDGDGPSEQDLRRHTWSRHPRYRSGLAREARVKN